MLGQLISEVRALDAFPKVEDSQREKSASGGIATLLVLAVLTYFTWGEFSTYFTPVQHHEFLVDHTINHELRINFDVTVAMACKYLTVDDIDVTGSQRHFDGTLKKIPTLFDTDQATDLRRERLLQVEGDLGNMAQFIRQSHKARKSRTTPSQGQIGAGKNNANEACRVVGSASVNKVAGNFHFTALGHGHGGAHTPHDAINFTHRVDVFSFGTPYPGLDNPLDNHFQSASSHMESFSYIMSVVPTIYSDAKHNVLITNQYAVRDFIKEYDEKYPRGVPGIFFRYDMEPISVRITESAPSLLRILTRLCAAVGGIFVCAGIAHRLLHAFVTGWFGDRFAKHSVYPLSK
ncbi:hypothetical protein IWQ62_002443 [Dispira parvispora]|uniref:Uncharacterized protein n=1 Tax=Dispira parvispora TaxID=1520584 RepID=A0A9W8E801_9FUNG|nr:hypothetical protein IWQ62_002443 [Dispira parvispora]